MFDDLSLNTMEQLLYTSDEVKPVDINYDGIRVKKVRFITTSDKVNAIEEILRGNTISFNKSWIE